LRETAKNAFPHTNSFGLALSPNVAIVAVGFRDETVKFETLTSNGKWWTSGRIALPEVLHSQTWRFLRRENARHRKQRRTDQILGSRHRPAVSHGQEGGQTLDDDGLSPDSVTLANAGAYWTVNLWNVLSKATLKGHKAGVSALTFSHDSKRSVTASNDGTTKVWDIRSRLSGAIVITEFARILAWSPEIGYWH
jgi:WD40 repeat protein